MTRYAEHTTVTVAKSRDEIEHTLVRFKANAVAWIRDDEKRIVQIHFRRTERAYRFTVKLANPADFKHDKRRYIYSNAPESIQAERAEQENMRLFRSLANYVKAILDAVDSGILTFEEAMMPHMMLPSGQTVAETVTGQMPALMEGKRLELPVLALPGAAH